MIMTAAIVYNRLRYGGCSLTLLNGALLNTIVFSKTNSVAKDNLRERFRLFDENFVISLIL